MTCNYSYARDCSECNELICRGRVTVDGYYDTVYCGEEDDEDWY